MRRERYIVLWPVYFDSRRPRRKGRRVPRSLAVPNPKLDELIRALNNLGISDVIIEEDKRYPHHWWEPSGRVSVPKVMSKSLLLKKVAGELRKLRSQEKG